MKPYFFTAVLTGIFLITNSCVKNPVTGKRDFMLMSEKQEIAMGQQSDPEIISFFGLYQDPKIQQFIDRKGQEMVQVSHRKNLKFEFKVVDSPVVNAFAVPGGYVYFTRGILAHFNNEAEFAGVLGHEIGHITARHSAKQYSKQMLAQVGLIAGMVISPEFAQFADVAGQGVSLLFLKHGRDAERQSDKLGVEYSTKIGYDSQEMAGFFNTLSRMRGDGGAEVPGFLSTHPDPDDRNKSVQELTDQWQKKVKGSNFEVNRDSYLRLIDGIVYGEDPKQGFVENNVFYHPVMKFQFPTPANWTLQNTPQQVQMAHPEGRALMILQLAQGNSLEAAAKAAVEQYQLTVVESRQVSVNGLNALAVIADQKQEQQTIRTLSYFISYGGTIYYLMGISSEADFNNFSTTFTNTMTNFRELTDQEKINRKPEKIRVKTVGQTTTLNQALRGFNMPQNRLEELAVLNGMLLDQRVEQGTLIKVIER